MNRFALLLMAVLTLGVGSAVAQRYNVSGRVVDVDNVPIAYATVVVLEDDTVVFEVKEGPFAPITPDNIASWTPAVDDAPAVVKFVKELEQKFQTK